MDNSGDKSSTYLIGALIVGAVLIGVALVVLITSQSGVESNLTANTSDTSSQSGRQEVSQNVNDGAEEVELSPQELGLFDGTGEKACYVAINGTVYEIAGSSLWQNGVHTIAGRDITCGKDLTEEMRGSPHGLSKLAGPFMTEVGKLK